MFGLLSFGSGLLFIGSLFVVYFRWFRSGSPDKLTNVSSSADSEAPEHYGKKGSSDKKTNLGAKSNGGEAFGHKNEGAQLIQNEGNEGSENVRHRSSANKSESQNGQDAERENLTTRNASNELLHNGVKTEEENEVTCEKDNLGEILQACETKEVKQQEPETEIKTNTCNVEISDKAPGDSTVSETYETAQDNEETTQNIEQKFVEEPEPDSLKDIDNTQEEANINNAIDSANEPLTGEANSLQKANIQEVSVEEPLVKVSEAISSEAAVELQEESSSSLGGRELIKEQAEQRNITGDLSSDLNLEVVANEPVKPPGVQEISKSQAENGSVEPFVEDNGAIEDNEGSIGENEEIIDNNENANFMPSNDQNISDSDADEVGPDNVIEKFSKRLSKCIIDAVLQDTQLLFSQSEDENDENCNRESILKFSDMLAESIVRSVVEYTNISQDHISEHDEHDRLSPSVADVQDKTNENINRDIPDEPSPTNEEEIFSADEANDDNCPVNLHEYAKRLSQQILSDVLDLNGVSTKRSSTDAYASKLTKSVLSNAINGAKSQIGDSSSLADSDLGVESAFDLFIAEIVGNAIESAVSRIGRESCRDTEEQNGIEDDLREQQGAVSRIGRELCRDTEEQNGIEGDLQEQQGEHGEGHVENHMDGEGQLETFNEKIGTPDHGENEPVNGLNTKPVQQNGKFQSKWLSEDDLDELYPDDFSDEDDVDPDESSKLVQSSKDDNKPVTSANHLTTPNDEKQFWRKSLIDDLDDDELDFDDIETPRSSLSSSPAKPANFEDLMVDGSEESDDEVLEETSTNVKVQAPISKATDSSRSRLRSGQS